LENLPATALRAAFKVQKFNVRAREKIPSVTWELNDYKRDRISEQATQT